MWVGGVGVVVDVEVGAVLPVAPAVEARGDPLGPEQEKNKEREEKSQRKKKNRNSKISSGGIQ